MEKFNQKDTRSPQREWTGQGQLEGDIKDVSASGDQDLYVRSLSRRLSRRECGMVRGTSIYSVWHKSHHY